MCSLMARRAGAIRFSAASPPVGCVAECDGLEDSAYTRRNDNATHLAPGLPGRVGVKVHRQAASIAALRGSQSKRYLHFFKELLPLRLL